MKKRIAAVSVAVFLCAFSRANNEPSAIPAMQSSQLDAPQTSAATPEADGARRADKRYDEMLDRMQTAVADVAQLYGNPVFLQVFTNDAARASELKQRLKAAQSDDDVSREMAGLEKKRDELLGDIALKQREAARLTSKLARQRAALDALAAAVEEARKAVEDTAK
jgi:hypothetical protein